MFDKINNFYRKSTQNWQYFCKKMSYMLDFGCFFSYTFLKIRRKVMIDIYDCEALVKIYHLLGKKCEIIDKFINNHAYYCGPYSEEYSAVDVYNDILDLMERKNQLINIKLMIDDALQSLEIEDKKVLYIKMNYNISINEFCGILNLRERTAYRRIEHAFEVLTDKLNQSKYATKLEFMLKSQDWIKAICLDVKQRRMAYKTAQNNEFVPA